MRTTITISADLFQRADHAAQELGISRSRLYQEAIERYLRGLRDNVLTQQANASIARYGQPVSASFRRYVQKAWTEGLEDDEW